MSHHEIHSIHYYIIKYFYLRKKFVYTYFFRQYLDIHPLGKITSKSQAKRLYSNTSFFSYVHQIYILVLHLNLLLCILLCWHFFRFQIFKNWWNSPKCASDSQERFLLYLIYILYIRGIWIIFKIGIQVFFHVKWYLSLLDHYVIRIDLVKM